LSLDIERPQLRLDETIHAFSTHHAGSSGMEAAPGTRGSQPPDLPGKSLRPPPSMADGFATPTA
jgi:hypothetical protein